MSIERTNHNNELYTQYGIPFELPQFDTQGCEMKRGQIDRIKTIEIVLPDNKLAEIEFYRDSCFEELQSNYPILTPLGPVNVTRVFEQDSKEPCDEIFPTAIHISIDCVSPDEVGNYSVVLICRDKKYYSDLSAGDVDFSDRYPGFKTLNFFDWKTEGEEKSKSLYIPEGFDPSEIQIVF